MVLAVFPTVQLRVHHAYSERKGKPEPTDLPKDLPKDYQRIYLKGKSFSKPEPKLNRCPG